MKIRLIIALAIAAALLVSAGAGAASPVTRAQAEQLMKRAASQAVRDMHRNLPPAVWSASCRRDGAGWWQCSADAGVANCYVGAGVGGTQTQPVVTRIHAACIR